MNYEGLNKLIDDSGLKRSYIAANIGMSPQQFTRRTRGNVSWSSEEIRAFSTFFRLTKSQRDAIFLP
jgi:hypothetical protein